MGSTPDRAVLVRALAGDIVLSSWARYVTLTVPLSTHSGEFNVEVTQSWPSIPSRGVEIFLVAL